MKVPSLEHGIEGGLGPFRGPGGAPGARPGVYTFSGAVAGAAYHWSRGTSLGWSGSPS